jgi:hypothetical protein
MKTFKRGSAWFLGGLSMGGFVGDELVVVEGDTLLRPGQVYMFATRVRKERGWHTLVPSYGDVLIADAEKQSLMVEKFRKATQEQIISLASIPRAASWPGPSASQRAPGPGRRGP